MDTSPSAEGTGIQIFGAIYAAAKYKELNAAEAERVRIEAQRVFDRNVERELERQKAKAKPQRKPRSKPSQEKAPRKRGGTVAQPRPPQAEKAAPTTEEAEVTQDDPALERQLRQVAVETVKAKYGTNIAVPVKNPDNKAVVAFASVVGERVTLATRTAYELNISSTAVAAAAKRNKPVDLDGTKYALLEETSVSISRP